MKKTIYLFSFFFLLGVTNSIAIAQEWKNWKKIIPLVSTCEEIKKIFNIEKCEYPYTEFDNSEWRSLKLAEKNYSAECDINTNYKTIPKGTILSVSILNIAIPLKDFEPDLSGYEIEQVYDLPGSSTYKNKKTGVEFEAFNLEDAENTMIIGSITLHPSAENTAKFGCPLQWKEIKPFVSNCEDLKRIFKINKCTFPTTKIETARFDLTVDFPKNVCGKKCNPKTNCWKVSKDTVLSTMVEPTYLSETITLRDFGSDWLFVKEPLPPYLDISKYTNADSGIALDVHTDGSVVGKIYFFPSRSDEEKYKCRKSRR